MSPEYSKYTHIPISLMPTSFSSIHFKDLIAKTPKHSELMLSVSNNTSYMFNALSEVCEIDDFTSKLVEISKKAHKSEHFQEISLGITRNDFMIDQSGKFFQVEFNTIAASFLSLGTKIVNFHNHVISQYGHWFENPAELSFENEALQNICKAFHMAWSLYGNKGSILFVVLEEEKNIFDQTFIELELWEKWYKNI